MDIQDKLDWRRGISDWDRVTDWEGYIVTLHKGGNYWDVIVTRGDVIVGSDHGGIPYLSIIKAGIGS